jgi:hypothetical protein
MDRLRQKTRPPVYRRDDEFATEKSALPQA